MRFATDIQVWDLDLFDELAASGREQDLADDGEHFLYQITGEGLKGRVEHQVEGIIRDAMMSNLFYSFGDELGIVSLRDAPFEKVPYGCAEYEVARDDEGFHIEIELFDGQFDPEDAKQKINRALVYAPWDHDCAYLDGREFMDGGKRYQLSCIGFEETE